MLLKAYAEAAACSDTQRFDEAIAAKDQLFSLPSLVEETAPPKPTLHRMLQQLETAGLLQRSVDGRHYGTGVRLRRAQGVSAGK